MVAGRAMVAALQYYGCGSGPLRVCHGDGAERDQQCGTHSMQFHEANPQGLPRVPGHETSACARKCDTFSRDSLRHTCAQAQPLRPMTRRTDELRQRSYEDLRTAAEHDEDAREALQELQQLRKAGLWERDRPGRYVIQHSAHHGWIIRDLLKDALPIPGAEGEGGS